MTTTDPLSGPFVAPQRLTDYTDSDRYAIFPADPVTERARSRATELLAMAGDPEWLGV